MGPQDSTPPKPHLSSSEEKIQNYTTVWIISLLTNSEVAIRLHLIPARFERDACLPATLAITL